MTKYYPIGTKSVQAAGTEYMDPSSYGELLIEYICQSVRYVMETQRESLSDINMPVCQKRG